MKEVERSGDYLVNLLHYEDAASLCSMVSPVAVQCCFVLHHDALACTVCALLSGLLSTDKANLTTAVLAQILQHSRQDDPMRGRTLLGCDGHPVSFQVGSGLPVDSLPASISRVHECWSLLDRTALHSGSSDVMEAVRMSMDIMVSCPSRPEERARLCRQ